jgi:hypothetical protein
MKVVKLDRRYANYPKFTHAIKYGKHEKIKNQSLHLVIRNALTDQYGPDFTWASGASFEKEYNDNWAHNRKRQMIYFKDEAMISHIMLLIS